jgi:hypothetical protein
MNGKTIRKQAIFIEKTWYVLSCCSRKSEEHKNDLFRSKNVVIGGDFAIIDKRYFTGAIRALPSGEKAVLPAAFFKRKFGVL